MGCHLWSWLCLTNNVRLFSGNIEGQESPNLRDLSTTVLYITVLRFIASCLDHVKQ